MRRIRSESSESSTTIRWSWLGRILRISEFVVDSGLDDRGSTGQRREVADEMARPVPYDLSHPFLGIVTDLDRTGEHHEEVDGVVPFIEEERSRFDPFPRPKRLETLHLRRGETG